MENKFKVGDLVECIDNYCSDLTFGDKYKVSEILNNYVVVYDNGVRFECLPVRFKLAEQEQEPNYMMVWDTEEKKAEKLEVFADLSDNPRYNNVYPVHVIKNDNTERHLHAKTIEQWKKDTGFLFENSLHERFFKGGVVYWVIKEENTINSKKINVVNVYGDNADTSEIMTKESAEKYVKEHEVKYKPFTMEEFKAYRDCWFVNISNKHINVKTSSYDDKQVFLKEISLSYAELLECFTFEDGTPCGVKE